MLKVLAVCLLVATSAFAAARPASKSFRLTATQRVSGVLQDIQGARIANVTLELLQKEHVVARAQANGSGEYDFGIVQPGEYRVRFADPNSPWCPPVVTCAEGKCAIRPYVKICITADSRRCQGVCL